jgi:glycosyltransferase involved in cell wall biosynthesis
VILEAMAEGLPVVATNVGGIPEIVGHEGTGYIVNPGNSIELRAAVRKLILSPHLRSHLGNAGRARAEGEFSIKKMVANVTDIYEAVIEQG